MGPGTRSEKKEKRNPPVQDFARSLVMHHGPGVSWAIPFRKAHDTDKVDRDDEWKLTPNWSYACLLLSLGAVELKRD
jgi:hypothetical protein